MLGKVIGGGLPAAAFGGPREADGADRSGRRRLPGGDAVRQPARDRRRARDAGASSTPAAYERLGDLTDRLAAGLAAMRPPSRPLQVAGVPGLVTLFFSAEPVVDFAGALACDTEALRPLLPGAARPRRLPAAVAVRGLVRLPRPRRGERSTAPSKPPPSPSRRRCDERTTEPRRRRLRTASPRSCARTRRRSLRTSSSPPHPRRSGRWPPPGRAPPTPRRVRLRGRGRARGLPPPLRRAAAAGRARRRPRPARRRLPLRARARRASPPSATATPSASSPT